MNGLNIDSGKRKKISNAIDKKYKKIKKYINEIREIDDEIQHSMVLRKRLLNSVNAMKFEISMIGGRLQ